MDKFNGIGPNFGQVTRKGFGEKVKNDAPQDIAKKSIEADVQKQIQHKSPDKMLDAMHTYGAMNLIVPKVRPAQNDIQMSKRIGEFMKSFENEVEKGLKIINEEFPGQPETFARQLAADAALKASEL